MNVSLVYLGHRLLYRIVEFGKHWYGNSFFIVSHKALNVLEALDRRLAFKITFRYWFKPLYQDYTFLGYVLGIFFRTLRIIAGSLVYLAVIIAAAVLYLLWALIPIYIIWRAL